ncbi:MAG: translation elongation factor-like protein [Deltaproteobacteria bacterium]|nr:translation elongation factor-like protein [Deltaproteobacteria bacterium]
MTDEQAREKKLIGEVTHFFGKISVAAIKLTEPLKVGDTISIEGATTNFTQTVQSMQIQNKNIDEAQAGDEVGIRIEDKAREGDRVFLNL